MFKVVCKPDPKSDLSQVERLDSTLSDGTYLHSFSEISIIDLICPVTAIKCLKLLFCLELALKVISGLLLFLEPGCVFQQLFKLVVSPPVNLGGGISH